MCSDDTNVIIESIVRLDLTRSGPGNEYPLPVRLNIRAKRRCRPIGPYKCVMLQRGSKPSGTLIDVEQ